MNSVYIVVNVQTTWERNKMQGSFQALAGRSLLILPGTQWPQMATILLLLCFQIGPNPPEIRKLCSYYNFY